MGHYTENRDPVPYIFFGTATELLPLLKKLSTLAIIEVMLAYKPIIIGVRRRKFSVRIYSGVKVEMRNGLVLRRQQHTHFL